jgi:hypothetical protein
MLRLNWLLASCVLALFINVGTAEAAGHGGGWNGGGWRWGTNHGRHHYNGGYYGGYDTGYFVIPDIPAESVSTVAAPESLGPLVPPTLALGCHHSQETITVPVESGGDQKITITRC